MRSSLPLRGYSSGSGIIPLQQHDQSIVDVEFGKAKDAPGSTFFLCPYVRLWAPPSSMRLACGRPLSRPRKSILVPGQLPSPKQAPVYHCTDCVTPNRRLPGGRLRPPAKFGQVLDKSPLFLVSDKLPRPWQRPAASQTHTRWGCPKPNVRAQKKRGAGGAFRLPDLHVKNFFSVLLQRDYTAAG